MTPKSLLQHNPHLRNAQDYQRTLRASVLSSIAVEGVKKRLNAHSTTQPARWRSMANSRFTLDSGKRGGRPCIRNLRISVYDVLEMLAEGMSETDIIEDFPELESADICACLAFAADREHNLYTVAV